MGIAVAETPTGNRRKSKITAQKLVFKGFSSRAGFPLLGYSAQSVP
jgi:hypothetical protein